MGAVHGVVLKYVGISAAAGAALALGPWEHPAWRWPLLVVACTNAVISALFLADRGTGLLGKSPKTGAAPWPYYVAWCGFIVPTWVYTRVHTSLGAARGVPEATEVAPGWWLGGRYADLAPGRPARWAGVLDLTCELPERCLPFCDDYKLVACWDGAPPAPDRLEAAASFCVAARRAGPVLVHCAHGRGRSTTCMVAALAKAGLFPDWRAALVACQRARPVVKLNARMRRSLDAWEAEFQAPAASPLAHKVERAVSEKAPVRTMSSGSSWWWERDSPSGEWQS